MKTVLLLAVALMFSICGYSAEPDDNKIRINVLGCVINPGVVYTQSKDPTVFDVLPTAGGTGRLFGRRISLFRLDGNGEQKRTVYVVPSPTESDEFEAELKKISIKDSDIIFFHEGCEL